MKLSQRRPSSPTSTTRKTTLVEPPFCSNSGSFRENQKVAERAMDFQRPGAASGGITILAKGRPSILYEDTRINIVDNPRPTPILAARSKANSEHG